MGNIEKAREVIAERNRGSTDHLNVYLCHVLSEVLEAYHAEEEEPEQGVTATNSAGVDTKYVKVVNLCDKCKKAIEPATPATKDKKGLDGIIYDIGDKAVNHSCTIEEAVAQAKKETRELLDAIPKMHYGGYDWYRMNAVLKALNLEETP